MGMNIQNRWNPKCWSMSQWGWKLQRLRGTKWYRYRSSDHHGCPSVFAEFSLLETQETLCFGSLLIARSLNPDFVRCHLNDVSPCVPTGPFRFSKGMHGQKKYQGAWRGLMTQHRPRPPKTAQAPRFRRQAAVGSEQRAATLQARYWYSKVTPSRHGKTWHWKLRQKP